MINGNQCFTVNYGQGEADLVPGGSVIPVTRDNLENYI